MALKNLLSPRLLPGLIVAVAGIILLLNSFGVVELGGLQRFWPLLLIAFGLHLIFDGGSRTFGIIVVVVGSALQLDNLGWFNIDIREVIKFWPTLFIALGAQMLIKPAGKDNSTLGIILIAGGGYFLGRNLDLIQFGIREMWPILIIAAGVGMLRKALART